MENHFPFSSRPYLITAILILAAGLVVSFFYIRKNSNGPELLPSPSVSAEITPSLEVARSILLAKAQIKFPEVISSSLLSADKLTEDLKMFLFNDATAVSVKNLQYENKSKGYQIDYILNTPFRDTFYRFTSLAYPPDSAKWQIVYSREANLFAFIEIENKEYQARVNQTRDKNNQSLVSIQIISK